MLNFENTFNFTKNTIIPNKVKANAIQFASLFNEFSLLIKPSKLFFATFTHEYYLPNFTHKINAVHFFDATFNYRPKNQKTDIRLIAKNILNKKSLNFIETTDYSFITNSNGLLNRVVVLNIAFKF